MIKISLQRLTITCLFFFSVLLIACQSKSVQPVESQYSTTTVVEASCGQVKDGRFLAKSFDLLVKK